MARHGAVQCMIDKRTLLIAGCVDVADVLRRKGLVRPTNLFRINQNIIPTER